METEKRPPGVMLYFTEMRPVIALLSAEERGELLMKIFDYAEYGAEPSFGSGDRLESVWPLARKMVDRNTEAYQEKCERAKKAVQARWDRAHGVSQRKEKNDG